MAYIRGIIWVMFFVVIVEMLFPSSDMKKYLKIVLGFIVLYTIVEPVAVVLTTAHVVPEDRITHAIMYYQRQLGTDVAYSAYEEERAKQEEGILAIYTEQLEKEVLRIVEGIEGAKVEDITIEATYEVGQYQVQAIYLDVGYETPTSLIQIGNKDDSIVLDEGLFKKRIKNSLNDFYNWDNTNIYITVQES